MKLNLLVLIISLSLLTTTSFAEEAFPSGRVAAEGQGPTDILQDKAKGSVEAALDVDAAAGKSLNGDNGGRSNGCVNCKASQAKIRGANTNPGSDQIPGVSSETDSTSQKTRKKQ